MNSARTPLSLRGIWAAATVSLLVGSSVSAQEWRTVWEFEPGQSFIEDIEFVDDMSGWASARTGIVRTTDGGETWEPTNVPSFVRYIGLKAFGPDSAWAVSNNELHWTIDRGQTWNKIRLLFPVRNVDPFGFWDIDCIDFTTCIAVGSRIAKTTDGSNWHIVDPSTLPDPAHFWSVSVVSRDTAWAVSGAQGGPFGPGSGQVFQSVDSGETWVERNVGFSGPKDRIRFVNRNDGFVFGWSGEISVTNDGGQTWSARNLPDECTVGGPDIFDAWMTDTQSGWIVGQKGVLFNTSDGWVTCDDLSWPRRGVRRPLHSYVYVMPGQAIFLGTWEDASQGGSIKKLDCTSSLPGCVAVVATEPETPPGRDLTVSAYPNPASNEATIRYTLVDPAAVRLVVFDVIGREVAVLQNGDLPAGRHDVSFVTNGLPPGQYFYVLSTDNAVSTGGLALSRSERGIE